MLRRLHLLISCRSREVSCGHSPRCGSCRDTWCRGCPCPSSGRTWRRSRSCEPGSCRCYELPPVHGRQFRTKMREWTAIVSNKFVGTHESGEHDAGPPTTLPIPWPMTSSLPGVCQRGQRTAGTGRASPGGSDTAGGPNPACGAITEWVSDSVTFTDRGVHPRSHHGRTSQRPHRRPASVDLRQLAKLKPTCGVRTAYNASV